MKTSNTPYKTILTLLSLGLISHTGLKAQEMSTNTPQGTNSCHQCRWEHHHGEFAVLTEDERQELKTDMQKIKGNAQLTAARKAVKDATTPDAAKAARKALQQTRKELLLQVDPKVQPILDKLEQAHKQHYKHGENADDGPTEKSN